MNQVEEAVDQKRVGRATPLPSTAERQIYRELLRILAPGEASCIAYAKTYAAVVVTDDRAARQCCTERDIPFTGTIAILKASCIDATVSQEEANVILLSMIDAGYYSPVQNISDPI
ncbi:MAG: hypothetical protein ISS35_05715 [Kiritimatiellae bacterium]|nr:hypothetical protein [Kiritimatiellia bacterium]